MENNLEKIYKVKSPWYYFKLISLAIVIHIVFFVIYIILI